MVWIVIIIGVIIVISMISGLVAVSQTGPMKASPEQREAWRKEAMRRDQERREAEERRKWMREHDAGEIGERIVAERFVAFDPVYMKVLQSVYVPVGKDGYTEVDLIAVHPSGIYVVESKNYRGVISGSEGDEQWRQSFGDDDRSFFNPITQNRGHVEAVKRYLGDSLKGIPCYSIIVFSYYCSIEQIQYSSPHLYVTKHHALHETLSGIASHPGHNLSVPLYETITAQLMPLTDVSDEVKAKHLAYVQSKVSPIDAKR